MDLGRSEPRATARWEKSNEVALVWTFDEDGKADFHIEAPTAEDVIVWSEAARKSGIHEKVAAAARDTLTEPGSSG